MKLKKVLLTLGAVFAFSLAACSGNSNSNTPSEGEGGQTPQADVSTPTYLTFIDEGKIRIDIMDQSLTSNFTYGNGVVESTKQMTHSSTAKLATRGDVTAANVNFIVVIDNDGTSSDRVSYHPGIAKESLEEFLNGTIDIATGKRIYVAISTGKINWTKGLNTALDQKLNAYNS